ncbi:hypothetical protein MKZ38_000910 [Zalerion maritima]|uniref:Uncharacterized protein n=1 Tax=Zalerion maritima TaxID=339359 RepID=A0AAD5RFF1_9PEZI|nr:hypothetical protein MKZ38_000910 [Zalerion maritima]
MPSGASSDVGFANASPRSWLACLMQALSTLNGAWLEYCPAIIDVVLGVARLNTLRAAGAFDGNGWLTSPKHTPDWFPSSASHSELEGNSLLSLCILVNNPQLFHCAPVAKRLAASCRPTIELEPQPSNRDMSADSLSSIWGHLSGRMDTSSLLAEVVGSSSLSLMEMSKPSHAIVSRQVRRLLVRLRILFDFQRNNFISDIASASREPRDDFLLAFDTCFETAVYLCHLGTLGTPETLGKSDYILNRSLALETLLSCFRLMCLHGTAFSFEQEDVLRERFQELADAWKKTGGLSVLEELVLCDLFPSTISEIQDANGGILKIQRLACGKYSSSSYKRNRTPFCREPESETARISSIRSTHEAIKSVLKTMDESTWVESFWSLCDICWAVGDCKIKRMTSVGSSPPITAAGVVEAGLASMFNCTPDSPITPGRERAVIDFFRAGVEATVGQRGPMFPAVGCTSDRVKRSIVAEAVDFTRFLQKRDFILKRQYGATVEEGVKNEEKAVSKNDESQIATSPNTNLNKKGQLEQKTDATPRSQPDVVASSANARRKRSEAQVVLKKEGEETGAGSRDFIVPPLKIERKPVLASPALSTSPTMVGTPPVAGNNSRPESYGIESERSSTALSPTSPQHRLSPPVVPVSPVSTPPIQGANSSSTSLVYESGLEVVDEASVPRRFVQQYPRRPRSGIQDGGLPEVIEESSSPIQYPPSPTPISEPAGEEDKGPEMYSPHPLHTRNQSSETASITSGGTAKKKGTSIFSRLSFGSRSSSASDSTPTKTPEDLEFQFSATSAVLLLYSRKGMGYLTRIPAPFHRAQRFYLGNEPGQGGMISGLSARLVAGGDSSVAALVVEGKSARLMHFDQWGNCCQAPFLAFPQTVPTSLAVSRDDSKIALGCGQVVHLYSRIHGRLSLEATLNCHSNALTYAPSNRRIQRVNFSMDSKKLIAATQESENPQKQPVFVCTWDCFGNKEANLDKELNPVHLSLGYGNDSGLTGIFYAAEINPDNARIFLTAATSKPYPSVLFVNKSRRNRHLDINEKRIDCAAQSPSSEPTNEGTFVFKSGQHRICLIDLRNGNVQEVANFASERSKLKLSQEAMAVGMPGPRLVYAFWRSADGGLILKQIQVGAAKNAINTMDLRNVYSSYGI